MQIFLNNQKNIQVKRATFNSEKLSSYVNINIIRGHFRALNEVEASINGAQYGKGFMLLTDLKSDIITGDKLTINNKEYNVQALTTHNRAIGNIRYKKAILSFNA